MERMRRVRKGGGEKERGGLQLTAVELSLPLSPFAYSPPTLPYLLPAIIITTVFIVFLLVLCLCYFVLVFACLLRVRVSGFYCVCVCVRERERRRSARAMLKERGKRSVISE
mmetsp:Transcript_25728/g.64807  ORF Transcript_25728/g.64807 Transcript_25728/m.64807 type:complete len:112 (+) Transcript_25728:3722-4057(+)